jgi:hypothetical protein
MMGSACTGACLLERSRGELLVMDSKVKVPSFRVKHWKAINMNLQFNHPEATLNNSNALIWLRSAFNPLPDLA